MTRSLLAIVLSKTPKCTKWVKPVGDFLKVNCDAAFDQATSSGGWEFIIRDVDGDVVGAGGGRLVHLMDPLHAETIACLQGAQAAADMGIGRVISETDAAMARNAVLSNDSDLLPVGNLVAELKYVLCLNFVEFYVNNVPRECNKVAHALAAWGRDVQMDEDPIVGSLPSCIQAIGRRSCGI
ncbi:hypothetical protein HU200_056291 [Digitaria exilis]|uniref:RNase H type-1 domain-containing protein n=1 Tax=Digitaria exilis TaxID=1010633 RepID=A0A835E471_9POAL|nr:hypothetical protein HU200_056291 [Digitaria exilis]